MRGDFTHDRFDRTKHFNRVLKQQGRVDLDADWNEQAAISLHLLRTFITDVVGRAAAPRDASLSVVDWQVLSAAERKALEALGVKPAVGDFAVTPGRIYVDGILVESDAVVAYGAQPHWSGPRLETGKRYLAYLDVWERHVSWIEDDSIREVALGGPDTCTRVQTVWQVKTLETSRSAGGPGDVKARIEAIERRLAELQKALDAEDDSGRQAALRLQIQAAQRELERLKKAAESEPEPPTCDDIVTPLREWTSGRMTARLEPEGTSTSPCVLQPESRYRGLENHLYRIEIHRGSNNAEKRPATFKWSRENGSVAARWLATEGNTVRVSSSRGFAAGQWIELTDDADELQGVPGVLTLVTLVDGDALTVTGARAWSASLRNPKVRRWDQAANDELTLDEGAITVAAGAGESGWIEIEHGIEVQFEAGDYRCGDYWLVPARVTTGTIEWPTSDGEWMPQPPRGVEHHYAPLAIVDAVASDPFTAIVSDCRCVFAPLACLPQAERTRPAVVVTPRPERPVKRAPTPRGRKKPG
jgi:hypothetical protein